MKFANKTNTDYSHTDKGPVPSINDMKSAQNQMPIDKPSKPLTNFVIAGQQYYFERLLYGVSFNPASFSSFMSNVLNPLTRQNSKNTYPGNLFVQDTTTDTMLQ